MAYLFALNFDQNVITGHRFGPGFRRGGKGGEAIKQCFQFKINEENGISSERVSLIKEKTVKLPWLYGPATMLETRRIVYPSVLKIQVFTAMPLSSVSSIAT